MLLAASAYQTAIAQGHVSKHTATLAGQVVLRDAEDTYNAEVYSLELPTPDANSEKAKLRALKEEISKKYPYKRSVTPAAKTTAAAMPTVNISFVADSFSGIPPDNYSAVSKGNKAVSVMNSSIAIHDATTGAYLQRKALKPFSSATGLGSLTNDYRFDPKVVYDPEADRFIVVMLNGINQYNYIVVGFSKTNDPTGAWNFYKFYGDYQADTTWFDYPALTITHNELFLTGNQIKYNTSWQEGFKQTLIYQIRKQEGYNGDTALNYQIWDDIAYGGRNLRCLYPVRPGDGLQGPGQYFLSNRNFDVANDSIFLVHVPDTIGGSSSLTVTPIVASMPYGVPPNGRQPDTAYTLATNDGRVLGGFIQGDEIQFVSTSLNPSNGASAVYHGTIANVTGTPTLTGRMYGIDTLDFGYPNISFAGNYGGANQSIISFEYTGPRTYPGYGAVLFDGTTFSDLLRIKNGDSSIHLLGQKEQRWGDYSGSQPDWNAIGVVWVLGIYGRKDYRYGNYMAQLVSPNFTKVPTTQRPKSTSRLYPNPAMEYVDFEFGVATAQVYSFVVYDMQGRVAGKLLDQHCESGKNLIRFNVAPFAPGTYVLRAMGANDETIEVHRFTRQ